MAVGIIYFVGIWGAIFWMMNNMASGDEIKEKHKKILFWDNSIT